MHDARPEVVEHPAHVQRRIAFLPVDVSTIRREMSARLGPDNRLSATMHV